MDGTAIAPGPLVRRNLELFYAGGLPPTISSQDEQVNRVATTKQSNREHQRRRFEKVRVAVLVSFHQKRCGASAEKAFDRFVFS